jgi:2-phospho-L-lactate guanylyltransferase
MSPSPERFAAIVPIRSWATGKSRLGLDDGQRASLARAFALDVVDVLRESPSIDLVVVVTSDDDVRTAVAGCEVVDDPGTGLNDAVAQGRDRAMTRGHSRIVVVPSDLPCLTVRALADVLTMSSDHAPAFCPDAEGDGTSLVVSRDPSALVTAYGPGSAAAHEAAGLVRLSDAPPEARRDVDTPSHLRDAEALGVGPHTSVALAEVTAQTSPRH